MSVKYSPLTKKILRETVIVLNAIVFMIKKSSMIRLPTILNPRKLLLLILKSNHPHILTESNQLLILCKIQ